VTALDTTAIRAWADHDLPVTPDGRMLITVAEWNQVRRDLLKLADEVDRLGGQREQEAA
jgi:hypothetical protein